MQNKRINRGHFRKGHDPRRHTFTREECSEGFWSMVDSIVRRYPNSTNAGGHMVLKALPILVARKTQA